MIDLPRKPHVLGGSGTAWLATGIVGCVFGAGMFRMIQWTSAGHAPAWVTAAFWGSMVGLGVLSGVYALTVASRRRPATLGVEPLTLADRNRLAADRLDDVVDDAQEPVAL